MKREIKGQKGVAAIEFALVLPLLLVLVFGIIEFSVLLYDKAMITNASREGARAGIVYSYPGRITDEAIISVVDNYCQNSLINFGGTSAVSTTITRTGNSSGNPLTVRVSYRYDFLVLPNFISALISEITLVAETVMRME
jgi:Flp pilus assembly protein TadG